jgi:hypothetical protein
MPGDRQWLDQRALQRRDTLRQPVRHAPLHHGVLGQSAAAVVALDREQRTMVVLAQPAVQTLTAALGRLDRDEIAELEVLDPLA